MWQHMFIQTEIGEFQVEWYLRKKSLEEEMVFLNILIKFCKACVLGFCDLAFLTLSILTPGGRKA